MVQLDSVYVPNVPYHSMFIFSGVQILLLNSVHLRVVKFSESTT